MTPLDEFSARIRSEIAAAENPTSSAGDDGEYMAGIQERTHRFAEASGRVLQEIVQPRLETVGSFFPNASPARKLEPLHRTWWFGYSEQFPASTKLDLYTAHDDRVETFQLCYEALIVPVFIKYDRFDRITIPLDEIDTSRLASWLEDRLIAFVHTYLSLGVSNRDETEFAAVDPVCGMRVRKEALEVSHDYVGHRYYFCSEACRDEFARDPKRYVTIVVD